MRFYTQQHTHYCGIDLHARQMYLCVLDAAGVVHLSRNIACTPQAFLSAVKAYRDDRVVTSERELGGTIRLQMPDGLLPRHKARHRDGQRQFAVPLRNGVQFSLESLKRFLD